MKVVRAVELRPGDEIVDTEVRPDGYTTTWRLVSSVGHFAGRVIVQERGWPTPLAYRPRDLLLVRRWRVQEGGGGGQGGPETAHF